MTIRTIGLGLVTVVATVALGGARQAGGVQRLSDGILLPVDGGFLRLQVKGDSIVRVLFSKVRDPRVDEMVVVTQRSATPKWTLQTTAASATLATAKLRATVNVVNGSVAFADSAGRPILTEIPGSHRMTPADVQGERTYNVQQMWEANGDESL
jgi:alpha-D-xyloside xylohydrolase